MSSRDYTILAVFVILIVASLSIPLWYHPDSYKTEDVYRYQGVDESNITMVDSPLGKYCMTISPTHSGEVVLRNKHTSATIPYVLLENGAPHPWDPNHIGYSEMVKGKIYTIYFDKPISDEDYHFVLHWKA